MLGCPAGYHGRLMACPKCAAEGWTLQARPITALLRLRWCPVQKSWMWRAGSVSLDDLKVAGVIRQ